MPISTQIEFEVISKYALFTEPLTRLSDEKLSSRFPTYSALRGVVESIYWKPTIRWIIDEVRILSPIRMASKGINNRMGHGEKYMTNPVNHTYLYDVRYQVRAHFEFNDARPDLAHDYNEKKHLAIAKRALKNGGRMPIVLGTTECNAYVVPCTFGEGVGYYDTIPIETNGLMLHSVKYPEYENETNVISLFWNPRMENGVIKFIRPEDCTIKFDNGPSNTFKKDFAVSETFLSVDDELSRTFVDGDIPSFENPSN